MHLLFRGKILGWIVKISSYDHQSSSLSRLDQNRAVAQISAKTGIPCANLKNVIVWGNHSPTQYPDVSVGYHLDTKNNEKSPLAAMIADDIWIQNEFLNIVQQRYFISQKYLINSYSGREVLKIRKRSSSGSASKAILDHLRDWLLGTKEVLYHFSGHYLPSSRVKLSQWEYIQMDLTEFQQT
jgi:malate/lactate dehydrogenase